MRKLAFFVVGVVGIGIGSTVSVLYHLTHRSYDPSGWNIPEWGETSSLESRVTW